LRPMSGRRLITKKIPCQYGQKHASRRHTDRRAGRNRDGDPGMPDQDASGVFPVFKARGKGADQEEGSG